MHVIGVLNRSGGTFRTMDMEAFRREAEAVFARYGHTLDCRIVDGSLIESELRAANADPRADAVLAGGGDGTISTAAHLAYESGVALAVLPAGTMNLFARGLQVPLQLDLALEALAAGTVGLVDIATANGKPFVHHFGVGIHARLVRIREGIAYRSRVGKVLASLWAVAAAAMRPPRFQVVVITAQGREAREASGIAVSNNPLGYGHMPHPDRLDSGVLGVYLVDPMSSWSLLRLFVAVLLGRFRSSPQVAEREVSEVILDFPRRKRNAAAVIDGELTRLARRVEIRLHPRALKVIHPSVASATAGTLVTGRGGSDAAGA